jgi:hypothetical protein
VEWIRGVIWWNGYHGYPLNTHGILILGMPLQVIGDPGQDFDFRSVSWWHRTIFSASVPVWEMWLFHPNVFHVGKSTIHLSSTTWKSGWSWNRGWNRGPFKANFPVPENGPFCLQRASKHIKTTCHFSKLSGWCGTLAQQFFLVPESLEGKIHRKRSRKPVSLIGKKQPVSCNSSH